MDDNVAGPWVFVAGDVHGNLDWMLRLLDTCNDLGCRSLLQLGDLGVWPRWSTGEEFIEWTSAAAAERGIEITFLDGNHEDHPVLRLLPADVDGWVRLSPSIRWARRGQRWTWEDRTFVALGGAHSVDRGSRVQGVTWFPEEEITEADLIAVGTAPADVLVCHEAPLGAPMTPFRLHKPEAEARYREGRARVLAAIDAVNPRVVLHGHWHLRERYELPDRTQPVVEALASDHQGDGRAWGLLDLRDLSFRDGDEVQR
jgi:Icc-related predicted phosphoesterase